MTQTHNIGLNYMTSSQAQKHVTVNEALRLLDIVVQPAVLSKTLATPPGTSAEGDTYLIAAPATGDWIGRENQIAAWIDDAWMFTTPKPGWQTYVLSESLPYAYDGSTWGKAAFDNSDLENIPKVGVNAAADSANRLAVKSDAILLDHDGAGSQVKINKNSSADSASLLFQTAYSGRAEIGLTGDDNLHLKVSPDGTNWVDAVTLDKHYGYIHLGDNGQYELNIKGGGAGYHNGALVFTATQAASRAIGVFLFNEVDEKEWFCGNPYNGADSFSITRKSAVTAHAPSTCDDANTMLKIRGADGFVGIGLNSPSAKLDVDGAVKVKSYAIAALPSASLNGAGSLIFVSDEIGGPVMAFSDGTDWRRATDRSVVA